MLYIDYSKGKISKFVRFVEYFSLEIMMVFF